MQTVLAGCFMLVFALGLLSLMATPLAKALAGKETHFTFQVSLGVNIVLTLATPALGGMLYYARRRIRQLTKRNKELEKRVKELKGRPAGKSRESQVDTQAVET